MTIVTTENASIWSGTGGEEIDHVLTDAMPSTQLYFVRLALELDRIVGDLVAKIFIQYSWDKITWVGADMDTVYLLPPEADAQGVAYGSWQNIAVIDSTLVALPWVRFGIRAWSEASGDQNFAYATFRIESRNYAPA